MGTERAAEEGRSEVKGRIIKIYRGQDVAKAREDRDKLIAEGKNAWLTRDEGMRGVQCNYNLWVIE